MSAVPLMVIFLAARSAARMQRKLGGKSLEVPKSDYPYAPSKVDTLTAELVDQADPEFPKVARGDDCISKEDFDIAVDTYDPPPQKSDVPATNKNNGYEKWILYPSDEDFKNALQERKEYMALQFEYIDTKGGATEGDGCITKEEFDFGNEMEGASPRLAKYVAKQVAEEALTGGMLEGKGKGPPEGFREVKECSSEEPVYAPPDLPLYGALDRNHDGTVTYEEVDKAAKETKGDDGESPPQFIVDSVKQMMDTDTSKSITSDEYCGFLKEMRTPEGHKKFNEHVEVNMLGEQCWFCKACWGCKGMDTSGDRLISKQEAYTFVSNMQGADLSQSKFEDIWKAADTDKDGLVTFFECVEIGKHYDGDGDEKHGHVGKDHAYLAQNGTFLSKNRTMLRNVSGSMTAAQKLEVPQKLGKNASLPGKIQNLRLGWASLWLNPRVVISHWVPGSAWLSQTRKSDGPKARKYGLFKQIHEFSRILMMAVTRETPVSSMGSSNKSMNLAGSL